MSRALVVAANWKMHKTAAEAGAYFDAFARAAPGPRDGVELAFFPPFPILGTVARMAVTRPDASAGAQNCHWEETGAFTGEVSAPMIVAAGARRVLVGHSERRQLFGETDETCGLKLRAALAAGLDPMLCVGETLEERDAELTLSVIEKQLAELSPMMDEPARLVIAYEPVWAIGTGRNATDQQAQEVHAYIRSELAEEWNPAFADAVRIIYGGSVKPENARGLMSQPDVDGALVGGASLKAETFLTIVNAAKPE